MKTMKLREGLYWNGILDSDLKVFDIIMYTEFGTTYNSYFIDGGEKKAICETAKAKFWEEYKAELESLGDIKDIDYIIVSHTEPDHAGSIENVLKINPRATVVATATAIGFLKDIINFDFRSMAVEEGDTLSLGNKTLEFHIFPNLHWPDTMYTYIREDKALLTCDSFGSHYAHEEVLCSKVKDEDGYWRATKYYFDNILGPFKYEYMNPALDYVEKEDIELILTGHGPVHDSDIPKLLETYREWCRVPKKDKMKVVVPYVSAYGYTGTLAAKIVEGLKAASSELEIHLYDMVISDAAKVSGDIGDADGIILGSPTILQEALPPIYNLTLTMFPPLFRGRLASAFGSYGWTGEAVPHLLQRLEQIGCRVLPGLQVRLKPSEQDLMDAFDFGYNFGCELLYKRPELKAVGATAGTTMVKCIICGDVFPAGTTVCPVCGAGADKFISVQSTETTFRKDTNEKFVILGGGVAAHNAVQAIRERNDLADITMISNESELPYNRPMLTKALLSDMSDNKLAIRDFEWYKQNRIKMKLDTKVESVNTGDRTVATSQGSFVYDKLIYALGAHCFVVPIKGADKSHVFTIRNIADCDSIKSKLHNDSRIVTIGGGVMGLEGAWELQKAGYDVTLLEVAPGLLPKQLDDTASEMLMDIVTKTGLKVVTGAQIEEITDSSVILKDGTQFPADIVIMSTGMKGNVDIAKNAGLEVDRLLVCDTNMHTSIEGIFGCGDCIQVNGEPQAFWSQACESGRIAGANAAGEELVYDRIPAIMSIEAFNSSIFALGTNGKDGREYTVIEEKDAKRGFYKKLYFFHNRLAGVILIGDTSQSVKLQQDYERGAQLKEFN